MENNSKSRRETKVAKEIKIGEVRDQMEPVSPAFDVFKSLSPEEQDDVIRLIIEEGGINKLLSILQADELPGVGHLMLDNVRYYNFFPMVREDQWYDGSEKNR